jgi:hypothetical protein
VSESIVRYHLSGLVKKPQRDTIDIGGIPIPRYSGEFWTSKQRQSSSIHEVSYRACFKAQLPRFFIELLTQQGDIVYDPFNGRGTTVIEAGLLRRNVIANDINPLSTILCRPRLYVPSLSELERRLRSIRINPKARAGLDLSMFYHPRTEAEIASLKNYLDRRKRTAKEDSLDQWIRMVATNRLTGHSKGFFSVYTLPPNQAVSPQSQIKINRRLKQKPEYRDTRQLILKKSKSLLRNLTRKDIDNLRRASVRAQFYISPAEYNKKIKSESVQLTVTSPHFLDTVSYSGDNWLRCWFNSIDDNNVERSIRQSRDVEGWKAMMLGVLRQLFRITKRGGWIAFEVGEIRKGSMRLEEIIAPLGIKAGFECVGIIINTQQFSKTSNIWGIKNNKHGTNSNRIALFYKD